MSMFILKALEHLKPSDNCLVGKAPENRDKNRYRDILPCKLSVKILCYYLFKPCTFYVPFFRGSIFLVDGLKLVKMETQGLGIPLFHCLTLS